MEEWSFSFYRVTFSPILSSAPLSVVVWLAFLDLLH